MSFSVATASLIIAGIGTAYGIVSAEESKNKQRQAEQANDREMQRLEKEQKNNAAIMDATKARDRAKLRQQSLVNGGGLNGTLNATTAGTYSGKTLLGS